MIYCVTCRNTIEMECVYFIDLMCFLDLLLKLREKICFSTHSKNRNYFSTNLSEDNGVCKMASNNNNIDNIDDEERRGVDTESGTVIL